MSFTSIAFRNIPRRKLRNSLTILAVILGVALIVGVNIAFDSVYSQFKDTISQALGNVDINVRSGLETPMDEDVLTIVREVDGVANASSRVSSSVKVSSPDGWDDATLIGVESSSDFDYLDPASTNITGTQHLEINGTDAVVSEGLNYSIGDMFEVNVTTIIFPELPSPSDNWYNEFIDIAYGNFTYILTYFPNYSFTSQNSSIIIGNYVNKNVSDWNAINCDITADTPDAGVTKLTNTGAEGAGYIQINNLTVTRTTYPDLAILVKGTVGNTVRVELKVDGSWLGTYIINEDCASDWSLELGNLTSGTTIQGIRIYPWEASSTIYVDFIALGKQMTEETTYPPTSDDKFLFNYPEKMLVLRAVDITNNFFVTYPETDELVLWYQYFDQISNDTYELEVKSTIYNFTVVGIYHPNPVAARYIGNIVYIDLVKAQTIKEYENEVDSIIIKVDDIKETDKVVGALNSKLGPDYIINPPKLNLLNLVDEATAGLKSGLQIMSVLALCVAIVIVLNTVYMNVGERTREIGILRSYGASTRQVFWMFLSESVILGVIGALVGLVAGIAMTNLFSYVASRVFRPFATPTYTAQFSLNPSTIQHLILGASAGLLTALIGGIFPSISACRIDVIKALRPSMRKGGKQRTALKLVAIGLPMSIVGGLTYIWFNYVSEFVGVARGVILISLITPVPMIGVVLLISGLLRSAGPVIERTLIPLGKTRKIISRNVERNLLRSTICFALIGMSLSFVIVISGAQTGVVMGVEDVIRSFSSSDLTVTSEDLISIDFADNLTEIDEGTLVSVTAPALIVPTRILLLNNETASSMNASSIIMAIDPTTYSEAMSMTFSEDTPSDVFTRLNNSGTVILTSPLAQTLNASIDDELKMRIIDYTSFGPVETWENFTVVGEAVGAFLEIMSFGSFPLSEACYLSYNSINDTFPDYYNMSNMFFVKAEAGQSVDYIRDRIKDEYGTKYDLTIITYNDSVEQVRQSIDEIFYILYSVVLFAVVNAAIGVVAIMVMNVAERRREIGIMRTQGLSKPQVIVSILGEVSVLGVVGFIMSVIIGIIFHRVTVSYMRLVGFPMPFIIPFNAFIISITLSLLTSIMSAVYPALRASNLNIVEALRRSD